MTQNLQKLVFSNITLTEKYTCIQTRQKMIIPSDIMEQIGSGQMICVSLEKIKFLNFAIVDFLDGLKQRGKPLIINILDTKDNSSLNIKTLYHFLSHLDSVDYITDKSLTPSLNIKHTNENFFSNSFFIGEEMSALTEERIRDMRSFFRKSYKSCIITNPKYLHLSKLYEKILLLQKQKQTVALVSGVFDVLHEGHLGLLEDASSAADILIVLTNSDYSTIRQAKNSLGDRPIHSLEERVSVLASLSCANYITAFDSENILPILSSLKNIIYVKTEKDIERGSIINEMNLVTENKGTNVIVPFSKSVKGNDLSSSNIIKTNRQKRAPDFLLSPDEDWSKSVIKKLTRTSLIIKQSASAQKLLDIKQLLRKRHSKIIDQNVSLEKRMIVKIISLSKDIIKQSSLEKNYYHYIIPYILGKLVHLNIKIVPIQNNDGESYKIVNALQLINGKTILFDLSLGVFSEPFAFEETYWKVMAHHSHYLLKTPSSGLPLRIFCYPFPIHYQALSLKMLLEDAQKDSSNRNKNYQKMAEISNHIWKMIEHTTAPILEKNLDKSPIKNAKWPGIVAHGGSAVLSQKFPLRAENSSTGIIHALKAGVNLVEIDVNACLDGWVVYHDQKLEIGTLNKGTVADMTELELTNIKLVSKTGEQLPERIITLKEALKIISDYKIGSPESTYVKIDVKYTNPNLEELFINTIVNSQIPLSKTLITSELPDFNKRVHQLSPELPFELNTVESNLFLLSYNLMDQQIMLDFYTQYIKIYSQQINAKTISLAQFAISVWGNSLALKLIQNIHSLGLQVQVWTITSIKEYLNAKSLKADYVLMQDPALIKECITAQITDTLPVAAKSTQTEKLLPYF